MIHRIENNRPFLKRPRLDPTKLRVEQKLSLIHQALLQLLPNSRSSFCKRPIKFVGYIKVPYISEYSYDVCGRPHTLGQKYTEILRVFHIRDCIIRGLTYDHSNFVKSFQNSTSRKAMMTLIPKLNNRISFSDI